MSTREHRQGARFPAQLWVAVEGVDEAFELRQGNLSVTGVYFESRRPVGEVGSVQLVRLASQDRRRNVEVMARVVRAARLDDLEQGTFHGVACEFMAHSAQRGRDVEEFVRHVASQGMEQGALSIDHGFQVQTRRSPDSPSDTAALTGLGAGRVFLHTTWPAGIGDTFQVQIETPSGRRRVPLEGRVTQVTPATDWGEGPSFHVELSVDGAAGVTWDEGQEGAPEAAASAGPGAPAPGAEPAAAEAPPSTSTPRRAKRRGSRRLKKLSQVVDTLMVDLVADADPGSPTAPVPSRRDHLVGALSRVHLSSLLQLIELQSMTGILTLTRGLERASLHVREGLLVKVDAADGFSSARAALGALMAWKTGSFRFAMQDVAAAPGMSITGLLLDLARQADEGG